MTIINGTINHVRPKTVIGINGAIQSDINGVHQYQYDKWRMRWNGNQFAPPELGSVLYLPGNPGFGSTMFDFSGNGNDGTIVGALWKQLPNGLSYLDFDGSDDWATIGSNLTKAQAKITLMAWVKPNDKSATQSVFGDYTSTTDSSIYFNVHDVLATGTWQLELAVNGDGVGVINSTLGTVTTRPYGVWAFIVGTWDGSEGTPTNKLFVNGVADGTEANADGTQTEATVTLNTTIGAYAPASSKQNVTGGIALPRIFTNALTPAQIMTIFSGERHLFEV